MHRTSVRVGLVVASLMALSGSADASGDRAITWSMSVEGDGLSASAEGDFATCCSVLTGYISDRTSEKDQAIFAFPGGPLGKLDAMKAGSYELRMGTFLFPGVARCTNLLNPMTVEITKGSPNAEGTFSGQVRCVDPGDPSVELDAAATISGNFTLRK